MPASSNVQGAVIASPAVRTQSARPEPRDSSRVRTIGAICESSRWLARRIGAAVGTPSLPIVELGAGYGSITRVLPETTVSIEREARRYAFLKDAFPDRVIIDTCAITYLDELRHSTVVVSSIPSVNNPEFHNLRNSVARARKAGTLTTLVTYTYFPQNPFADIFPISQMVGLELLNISPAFVWRYSV